MSEPLVVINAEDVTDDVIDAVWEVVESWYPDRINWEDTLYRVEERGLPDGRGIEFGSSMVTPAIEKIKRVIRGLRKSSW